jgi:hypothetical protein
MLGVALGEGVYLTAWPRFAALAPAGALLFGVIAGWRRLGGEQVFTQSEFIIAVAVGLGLVSAQLGALFTAGYAIGDFLLWRNPGFPVYDLMDRLQLLGGLLVVYVALAMLAIGVPLAVRALRAQTPLPSEEAADARVVLDTLLGGVLAASLTYLYIQALPMLIRPLFVWRGSSPSVESVTPAQQLTWVFVLVAVVVGAARVLVEYGAGVIDPGGIGRRAAALDSPGASLWERLPAVLRVAVASVVGTGLLGGLLFTWAEAGVLFGGLLTINAIRTFLPPRILVWPRTMERIPAILRLPAALGLGYIVSSWVVSDRLFGHSFIPLIWGLLAALLCVALLFPASHEPRGATDRIPTTETQT